MRGTSRFQNVSQGLCLENSGTLQALEITEAPCQGFYYSLNVFGLLTLVLFLALS